jgi:hypothetical protein
MADVKFTKPVAQLSAEVRGVLLAEMQASGYAPNPSDLTTAVNKIMGIINREVVGAPIETPKSTYVDPTTAKPAAPVAVAEKPHSTYVAPAVATPAATPSTPVVPHP